MVSLLDLSRALLRLALDLDFLLQPHAFAFGLQLPRLLGHRDLLPGHLIQQTAVFALLRRALGYSVALTSGVLFMVFFVHGCEPEFRHSEVLLFFKFCPLLGLSQGFGRRGFIVAVCIIGSIWRLGGDFAGVCICV